MRQEFNDFSEWVVKMIDVGSNIQEVTAKHLPFIAEKDFRKPDTFTDEEISELFAWLESDN